MSMADTALVDLILSKPWLSALSQKRSVRPSRSMERDGEIADACSRNMKFPPVSRRRGFKTLCRTFFLFVMTI